ncbi:MAG: O-antigen ligase family protein [Thiobacillus sp.]|nr:O-antigen ligase family protein [Thiobacillus sp.]
MKRAAIFLKPDVRQSQAAMIGLAILAGIDYYAVAWTALILLAWVAWVVWPRLASGVPFVHGYLPAVAGFWLVWLVAHVWISDTPYLSWFYAWTLAGLPIALLAWQFVREPEGTWRWIERGLWAGATIGAIQGIWQIASGESVRAHGPLVDPNAYAGALNLIFFPLAAAFLARDDSRKSHRGVWIQAGILFLLALAFFSANSRGGMIAWLMGLCVLLFALRKRPGFWFRAMLLLTMWAVAAGIMYLYTAYNLLQVASFQDESVSARVYLWRSSWMMIQANPWLGTGLGTWSLHYPAFRDHREWSTAGYYAHNDYLQLLAETGPLTLVILFSFLMLVVHKLWKLARQAEGGQADAEAIGLLVGVLAVATHAFVNFIFYHAFISILCGLYVGRSLQLCNGMSGVRLRIIPVATALSRKMIIGTVFFVLVLQLLLHEAARLLNCDHPVISAIHRIYPSFTELEAARFIHAMRPQEPIPRNIVLRYMSESIADAALLGPDMPKAVLIESIEAYSHARKSAVNRTQLGAEQAMLLIRHRGLLPTGEALQRAEEVVFQTLKLDPRHAESILALAEIQFARGETVKGLNILVQAIPHIFSMRDRRLLEVVYLQRLLAPAKYPALDSLEKKLRQMPSVVFGSESSDAVFFAKAEKTMYEVLRQSGRMEQVP